MFLRENRDARIEEFKKHKPEITNWDNYNYRLTQEWEVPEWIKVKPEDPLLEEQKELGKRQRKTVIHVDNLSEAQWLKAVEEGEDLQQVIKRNIDRREKRLAEGGILSDDDEYEEEYDNSGDEFVMKKKQRSEFKAPRNRPPKQLKKEEPSKEEVAHEVEQPKTSPIMTETFLGKRGLIEVTDMQNKDDDII